MSYVDKDGNTVLYRALYSVDKEGNKIIITSHCLDDEGNVIINPRTKKYIQKQGQKDERG